METLKRTLGAVSLATLALSLSACGLGILSEQKAPPRPVKERILKGIVYDMATKTDRPLDPLSDRPLLAMFADDTCGPCGKEADEVRALLDAGDTPLKKDNLITIMTGSWEEDVELWIQTYRVEWPVVIDRKREIFKTYCEYDQTPCTVIQRPDSGIVYAKVGFAHPRDLLLLVFPEWLGLSLPEFGRSETRAQF